MEDTLLDYLLHLFDETGKSPDRVPETRAPGNARRGRRAVNLSDSDTSADHSGRRTFQIKRDELRSRRRAGFENMGAFNRDANETRRCRLIVVCAARETGRPERGCRGRQQDAAASCGDSAEPAGRVSTRPATQAATRQSHGNASTRSMRARHNCGPSPISRNRRHKLLTCDSFRPATR